MKMIYPAVFTPDEDGHITVEIPDLPGCVTFGDSLEDAVEMGTDAASGWILGELEEGNSYPAPSSYKDIKAPEGSFVSLLLLDIDSYAEKYGSKTVRKNITIPAWLNTFGEKNHISFSKVLTEALMQKAILE